MARNHTIVDDDGRFIIDGETGKITNASGAKLSLMQRNRNSERFTFEMPRTVEGHDILECDLIEIGYQNTGKGTSSSVRSISPDKYKVEDITVDPKDENRVIFTWLLGKSAALYAGSLSFQIWFECYADDFVWQTDIYSDVTIKPSLGVNEAIADTYPDALEELGNRMSEMEKSIGENFSETMDEMDDRVSTLETKVERVSLIVFTDDGEGNVTMSLTNTDGTPKELNLSGKDGDLT